MQWKIVYNLTTGIVTAVNSIDPQEGEGVVYLDPSLCGWVNTYPENYKVTNGSLVELSKEEIRVKELVKIKESMWQKIKAERDSRMSGGFKVEGKWYHSDEKSRLQHLGLTILGAGLPDNIDWKTMDKSKVRMTPQLVQKIFQAALILDTTLHAIAEGHKVAMEASLTPESYDYLAGWPEKFE